MLITTYTLTEQPLSYLLLAASSKRGQIPVGFLVVVAAILLTLGLAVVAFSIMRRRPQSESEQALSLFRDLCRAHQLTGMQRQLMLRLAGGLKLASPSTLFVDNTAWRIPEDNQEGGLDKKDWDKLQQIQRMLFMPANAVQQHAK
ncbi:MAG: hypothetical protein IT423_10625 [Pirellulaceae bacterium]|nr:hypothetical protein [Pirellulaceae bacterium]